MKPKPAQPTALRRQIYDSVPANAQTTPYDASEPLSRNEINSQTQKATEKPDAETTSDSEATELVQPPVSREKL